MSYYIPVDFEPSPAVKNFFPYLRKNVKSYIADKTYKFVGLIGEDKFAMIGSYFLIAIIIESLTIAFLWGSVSPNLLLFVPFVLDVLLAIVIQIFQKPITLNYYNFILASEEYIYKDGFTKKAISNEYLRKYNTYKYISYFVHLFLIIIALMKIIFIFGFSTSTLYVKIILCALHVWVLYLHINYTGSFILEFYFRNFLIKNEIKNYDDHVGEKSIFRVNTYRYEIIKKSDVVINDTHKLVNKKFKHFIYKNILFVWGVLTDSHLTELVAAQDTEEAKKIVALMGIKHQMDKLNDKSADASLFGEIDELNIDFDFLYNKVITK
jgi:hypothetical protein